MDVRNCRSCGRLFNYISGPPICRVCRDALEDKFQDVKSYLREHPDSSIQVVSDENDVSIAQIRQWVREERLTFSPDSPSGIECEGCGKTIKTGRFCAECKNKVKKDLDRMSGKKVATVVKEPKTHEKDRMRFLDK